MAPIFMTICIEQSKQIYEMLLVRIILFLLCPTLPNGHYDAVKMDANPSHGVSTVEDRAKVFSTTVAYSDTKAHQSSQQNNSAQIHHNPPAISSYYQ